MSASAQTIRIHGQGPVGLALALFARRAGVPAKSIVFDDTGLRPAAHLPAAVADRAIALSLGSWQLLMRIIKLPPAAAIAEVEVSLLGSSGRTFIRASELRVPALGYVTRYGPLLQELMQACQLQPGAARADGTTGEPGGAVIVHAEGAAGDNAKTREFGQDAVLCTLRVPAISAGTALERFTRHGPAALLPLAEPANYSLVWCGTKADCTHRLALDDDAFLTGLREVFGARLLQATVAGPRSLAPLVRRQRTRTHSGSEVWIGNAAQTLHPVAGQGLNLGLRDAFELAQALGQLFRTPTAASSAQIEKTLAEYSRARRADRNRTVSITDALASVFTTGWIAPAQSLALAALDLATPARDEFARRLMFGQR